MEIAAGPDPEGAALAQRPAGVSGVTMTNCTRRLAARAARVLPVLDATQSALPPGPIAYTRLRALGKAAASVRSLERLAAALRSRREAFVVAEDPKVAASMQGSLAGLVKAREQHAGPTLVRPAMAPLIAEDEEQ